jgi:hypothetical protein
LRSVRKKIEKINIEFESCGKKYLKGPSSDTEEDSSGNEIKIDKAP